MTEPQLLSFVSQGARRIVSLPRERVRLKRTDSFVDAECGSEVRLIRYEKRDRSDPWQDVCREGKTAENRRNERMHIRVGEKAEHDDPECGRRRDPVHATTEAIEENPKERREHDGNHYKR